MKIMVTVSLNLNWNKLFCVPNQNNFVMWQEASLYLRQNVILLFHEWVVIEMWFKQGNFLETIRITTPGK